MQAENDKKPWYRQPLVWLVIAFPAAAVIGGISILILSIRIDDGVVVDDYYKKGKEINQVLTRDRKAGELGMRGVSVYAADTLEMSVTLASSSGADIEKEAIQLDLMHATRGGMDVRRILETRGNGLFQTTLDDSLAKGPWIVQIGTSEWRIHGRIHVPDNYVSPLSVQ